MNLKMTKYSMQLQLFSIDILVKTYLDGFRRRFAFTACYSRWYGIVVVVDNCAGLRNVAGREERFHECNEVARKAANDYKAELEEKREGICQSLGVSRETMEQVGGINDRDLTMTV